MVKIAPCDFQKPIKDVFICLVLSDKQSTAKIMEFSMMINRKKWICSHLTSWRHGNFGICASKMTKDYQNKINALILYPKLL